MRSRLSLFVLCVGLLTMMCGCDTGPGFLVPTTVSPPPVVTPRPTPVGPTFLPAPNIAVGDVIRGTIGLADPICDPSGWDARSPCKRFLLTPVTSGTLNITLTTSIPVPRGDVIDFQVFGPGLYLYSEGGAEQRARVPVVGGNTYEIRIDSYPYLLPPPGDLDFELRTEM